MSKCKFLYVRNELRKRDITIVSDIIDKGDKKYVKFAWTFRCNHDKFIKKEGRQIAKDRLNSMLPGYSSEVEIDDVKFYNIAAKILSVISCAETTPKKFLQDILDDLQYFAYFAGGEKPSWESVFSNEE